MGKKLNERVVFDADRLNERQADGLACVLCGADFTGPSVPIGHAVGGQVFCCATHAPDAVRSSVPGQWPNGEPQAVRDAADERAEPLAVAEGIAELLADAARYADLADRFAEDGDEVMADALDYVCGALRYLRKTVESGGDVGKALDEVDKALSEARIAVATVRADEQDERQDDEDERCPSWCTGAHAYRFHVAGGLDGDGHHREIGRFATGDREVSVAVVDEGDGPAVEVLHTRSSDHAVPEVFDWMAFSPDEVTGLVRHLLAAVQVATGATAGHGAESEQA